MAKSVDLNCRAFKRPSRSWPPLERPDPRVLQDGPLRFSELEDGARGLGPKTLSARLRALEAGALIARRVEPGPPARVQYP